MIYDNYQTKLEAERLRLSNAETVYAWLSALPASDSTFTGNVADVIVKALLERDDPLINLGLARFTANYDLLNPLWDKGGLVRTALLANQAHGPLFPTSSVFGAGDPDPLRPHIEEMSVDDLDALYSNPRCPAALLEQTFRNTIGLSEDRHLLACRFAIRNERLRTTLGHDTFDEFTEAMEHAKPINAIWDMVRTAPATEPWASVFVNAGRVVFELKLPREFTPDMSTDEGRKDWNSSWQRRTEAYRAIILKVAQERWLGPEDKRDDPHGTWTWARAAISEAVCRTRPYNPEFTWRHPDLGIRIGFYRAGAVTPEWDIEGMAAKDGKSFMDALVWNDTLYERGNHNTQSRFRRMARSEGVDDDVYVKWMDGKLETLTASDPKRYGAEPTEEMEEHYRQQEAREEAADLARRRREEAANAPPKPAKKGWGIFR